MTNTVGEATHREACLAAGFVLVATAAIMFLPFMREERTPIEELGRHGMDPKVVILVLWAFAPAIIGVVTLLAVHRGAPRVWHRAVTTVCGLPFVLLPLFVALAARLRSPTALSVVGLAVGALALLTLVRAFFGDPWKRFANLVAAPIFGVVSVTCIVLQDSEPHRSYNLGTGAIVLWTTISLLAPLALWMALPRRSKNA